jgi:hypothetical protein
MLRDSVVPWCGTELPLRRPDPVIAGGGPNDRAAIDPLHYEAELLVLLVVDAAPA